MNSFNIFAKMTLFIVMCQKSKVKGKVKHFTLYQHKTDKIRLKINILFLVHTINWQSFNYNLDFVNYVNGFYRLWLYFQDKRINTFLIPPLSHLL